MSCKDGMWEKRLFTSGVYMGYDLFLERLGKAGNTWKEGLQFFGIFMDEELLSDLRTEIDDKLEVGCGKEWF